MRVPDDHPLARTLPLLRPAVATAAAEALRGSTDRAAVEGLVELLLNPKAGAGACATALRSLEENECELAADAAVRALANPHASVRILAAQECVRRGLFAAARPGLEHLLRSDPYWQVRRAGVLAVSAQSDDFRWAALYASTDPHWRVRYALVQCLESWRRDPVARPEIDARLAAVPGVKPQRLLDFLAHRWDGTTPPDRPDDDPPPPDWCPFWDWDAAVLARNLDRLGRAGRQGNLSILPRLVTHPDERVRRAVVEAVRDDGEPHHWADLFARLGDPRDDPGPVLESLVKGVDGDQIEAVAKFILKQGAPAPAALAWAVRQAGESFPAEEVAGDLERLAPAVRGATPPEPPDAPFPADHPHARAAALTQGRARELVADPTCETSWFVLARAAQLCRTPVWELEPERPWPVPALPTEPAVPLALPEVTAVRPRQLGPGGPFVSPLGVSGHYGLPVDGFVRAVEAGVNLFFWEPNYATLTRFFGRLTPSDRRELHTLAGTFEADGAKVRRDAERALRNLKVERLGVFLIFWVQSWGRITDDVRRELDRLKDEGKVQVYGLSTHARRLAVEAVLEGWNPIQIRHSAAHRKAEAEVFPEASNQGTGIITFNNTCYGRLLDPGEKGEPAFRPADCYRFTLAHPAVTCCFTAPATLPQLDENLDALRNPHLDPAVREALLRRGEWLYREDTAFRRTVRAGG